MVGASPTMTIERFRFNNFNPVHDPEREVGLALQGNEGGTPLLLDVDLEALDLTEAEKAAFRAAFLAQFGERAAETAAH